MLPEWHQGWIPVNEETGRLPSAWGRLNACSVNVQATIEHDPAGFCLSAWPASGSKVMRKIM
jgi:hypothetical protein